MNKVTKYSTDGRPGELYAFHCPGCGYDHGFWVGNPERPSWTFNGSLERPTFTPSLLCNQSIPENRCHSFVTDGKIQFLGDSWHALKGQTVELPDWNEETEAHAVRHAQMQRLGVAKIVLPRREGDPIARACDDENEKGTNQ